MRTSGNPTAAFYDSSTRAMAGLRGRAEATETRIATGERLARSSDDPIAASRLRTLDRADRLGKIDLANANRASADLSSADNALSQMSALVIRARELAMQAGNGTLSAENRAAIGAEMASLQGQLVDIANFRGTAGHALFGGQTGGNAYTVDSGGNAVYIGTASTEPAELGEGISVTRGLTGPEILNFSIGGTPGSLPATIKTLADALTGGSPDPAQSARDAIAGFDSGLNTLTTAQTIVGARLVQVDGAIERNTVMTGARAQELADTGGADLAASITELKQTMLVLEASQASFARMSALSLFNILR